MTKAVYVAGIAFALLVSCSTPSMVTTWKSRDTRPAAIHSVLVVGIMGGDDSVARAALEKNFAIELQKNGFNASSAIVTFGSKGLSNLGQEQTLALLCNYGFDAIMTIALVDERKAKYNDPPASSEFIARYYLDRIWAYDKIAAAPDTAPRYWELVLYDLYALRPLGAIQTHLYAAGKMGGVDPIFAQKVVARMLKQKMISRPKSIRAPSPAPPIVKQ